MNHVAEDLHDIRLVDGDPQHQLALVPQRRREPDRHRLQRRRVQQNKPIGIVLRQARIGGGSVGQIGYVPAIDIQDDKVRSLVPPCLVTAAPRKTPGPSSVTSA